MIERNIILFSDNHLLFDALKENFKFDSDLRLVKQNWQQFLNDTIKIDLLIIDSLASDIELPTYKIRNIINLTNQPINSREIHLHKPIRLIDLAKIINKSLSNNLLFEPIGSYIYNEFESSVSGSNVAIKLTEKENAVISYLMKHRYAASKFDLFQAVWHYNENTETSTFETHIYKLKHKLPEGMLKIQGDSCILNMNLIGSQ